MKMAFSLFLLFTSLSVFGEEIIATPGTYNYDQSSDASAYTAVWIEGQGEQLVHKTAIGLWGPCQSYMFSKKFIPGGSVTKLGKFVRPGYEFQWTKMNGSQCRTI